VSSSSTQPLPSIIQPATLTLPHSTPLSLAGGNGVKALQFVLPPAAIGSAVGLDSSEYLQRICIVKKTHSQRRPTLKELSVKKFHSQRIIVLKKDPLSKNYSVKNRK
jgi:hypothetical protein